MENTGAHELNTCIFYTSCLKLFSYFHCLLKTGSAFHQLFVLLQLFSRNLYNRLFIYTFYGVFPHGFKLSSFNINIL